MKEFLSPQDQLNAAAESNANLQVAENGSKIQNDLNSSNVESDCSIEASKVWYNWLFDSVWTVAKDRIQLFEDTINLRKSDENDIAEVERPSDIETSSLSKKTYRQTDIRDLLNNNEAKRA